jgi:selenium-binding protein 1
MQRRDFIKTTAATSIGLAMMSGSALQALSQEQDKEADCCDRTWATVADAIKSPRETLLYVPAIYTGTDVKQPDYLATIDADPASATFGQVIHRLPMLNVGDELHHFGWNSCSSCHGQPGEHRRFMLLPGIASSRIYVVDTADPKAPKIHKVVEPNELRTKANLSAPHTVHCLADGHIMISCLGDAAGNGPGGFALLNQNF